MNIQKDGRKRRPVNKRVMLTMFALLIASIWIGPASSDTNLALYMNAPVSFEHGKNMTYNLYFTNLENDTAFNVVLNDTLPSNVDFISASDGGTFDPATRNVTWMLGDVPGGTGRGDECDTDCEFDVASVSTRRTVKVQIPISLPEGTLIVNTASISTTTPEMTYDDNSASAQTTVTESALPANVSVEPNNGNYGGTTTVHFMDNVTFSYHSCGTATAVNITINVSGFPDITDSMTGGPPDWTYSITFAPRHGLATITLDVTGCGVPPVVFNIYIDPAGFIYDAVTGLRIAGATVTLQRPVGLGAWENVPTGQAIMIPDVNPLITGIDGQYQWDTLAGTYRVNVTAPAYNPADSIAVTVPPPVTDLHVGLTPLAPPGLMHIKKGPRKTEYVPPPGLEHIKKGPNKTGYVPPDWQHIKKGQRKTEYVPPPGLTHIKKGPNKTGYVP